MELRQLRHFVAVVETGNLTRAAGRIPISQPALTRSIRNLEQRMRVELLERNPRGVTPTAAGVQFYKHAKIVLNECSRITNNMSEFRRGTGGTVRVGIAAMFSRYVIDQAALEVSESHPKLAMVIRLGLFEDLVGELEDGRLDLVFSNLPPVSLPSALDVEVLGQVHSAIVANSRHPLAKRRKVEQAELVDAKWVVIDQPHAHDFLDTFFSGANLPTPPYVVRTNSLALIQALISSGEFLSVMPLHMVAAEVSAGTVRQLAVEHGSVERAAALLSRHGTPIPAAAEPLMEAIRGVARRVMPQS